MWELLVLDIKLGCNESLCVARSDNGPGWLQSAEDKAGRFLESAEDNAGSFFQQMKTTLRSREAQEMIFYILVCMQHGGVHKWNFFFFLGEKNIIYLIFLSLKLLNIFFKV